MIDIGVNLASSQFERDRELILNRARDNGVRAIVLTGSSKESNQFCAAYCDKYRDSDLALYFTAGLHPHHADQCSVELLQQIKQLASHRQHLAVGEMGLDFFRMLSSRVEQERAFHSQLECAVAVKKPVFLHQREAHKYFVSIFKQYRDSLPTAIVHCFTDSKQALFDYLDLDCYIGITGWVTEKKRGSQLRELVRYIPADRLLIETDAPYLLPHNIEPKPQSRRNEPQYLSYVLKAIAEIRQQPLPQLVEQTSTNAINALGIGASDT